MKTCWFKPLQRMMWNDSDMQKFCFLKAENRASLAKNVTTARKKSENGQMFRLKRSSAIDGSKYFCTTPLNAGKQRLPLNAKQSQNESPWLIVTKKHDGRTQKWTEGLKSSSSTPLTFTITPMRKHEEQIQGYDGIWWIDSKWNSPEIVKFGYTDPIVQQAKVPDKLMCCLQTKLARALILCITLAKKTF